MSTRLAIPSTSLLLKAIDKLRLIETGVQSVESIQSIDNNKTSTNEDEVIRGIARGLWQRRIGVLVNEMGLN